jgi:hypothetical protein
MFMHNIFINFTYFQRIQGLKHKLLVNKFFGKVR